VVSLCTTTTKKKKQLTVRLTYQPPARSTFISEQISHQQLATVLFSQNKSAPTTSHQPNERAADHMGFPTKKVWFHNMQTGP
jgi:hypothetical protein